MCPRIKCRNRYCVPELNEGLNDKDCEKRITTTKLQASMSFVSGAAISIESLLTGKTLNVVFSPW
jgi:hypothetical protein